MTTTSCNRGLQLEGHKLVLMLVIEVGLVRELLLI